MDRSTFLKIKLMSGLLLFFLSMSRYIIGVVFKILARTPVPKSPPPPTDLLTAACYKTMILLLNYSSCFVVLLIVCSGFV